MLTLNWYASTEWWKDRERTRMCLPRDRQMDRQIEETTGLLGHLCLSQIFKYFKFYKGYMKCTWIWLNIRWMEIDKGKKATAVFLACDLPLQSLGNQILTLSMVGNFQQTSHWMLYFCRKQYLINFCIKWSQILSADIFFFRQNFRQNFIFRANCLQQNNCRERQILVFWIKKIITNLSSFVQRPVMIKVYYRTAALGLGLGHKHSKLILVILFDETLFDISSELSHILWYLICLHCLLLPCVFFFLGFFSVF